MTLSEAIAWQAVWIFVLAYVVGNVAFLKGEEKLLSRILWTIAIVMALYAVGMWSATIWINYNTLNT